MVVLVYVTNVYIGKLSKSATLVFFKTGYQLATIYTTFEEH